MMICERKLEGILSWLKNRAYINIYLNKPTRKLMKSTKTNTKCTKIETGSYLNQKKKQCLQYKEIQNKKPNSPEL